MAQNNIDNKPQCALNAFGCRSLISSNLIHLMFCLPPPKTLQQLALLLHHHISHSFIFPFNKLLTTIINSFFKILFIANR
jgi:hypothetical protein